MADSGLLSPLVGFDGNAESGIIFMCFGWFQWIFTVAFGAVCAKSLFTIIYNVYFHPLRNFPGPKLAAATPLPFAWRTLNGEMVSWTTALHAKYGVVVRTHPDELSFIGASAWKDIYMARPQLPKPTFGVLETPTGTPSIATIPDPETHGRQRKILNHAFSDRALRGQEYILHKYSNLLISRLGDQGSVVNICDWYNFTTFDITGDLLFAESFHCLETADNHPWMVATFRGVKFAQMLTFFHHFPPINSIVKGCIPSSVMEKAQRSFTFTREKVDQRIALKSERPDFMKYILENNHLGGMTREEIDSTSTLLVLAGSETSATTLTSATYYSLSNPPVFEKLRKEIRGAFGNDPSRITVSAASELPYMHAVIQEALRMHPPGPISVPRQIDRPLEVCGMPVPPGVRAGISQKTAFSSPTNFVEPDRYIPERWLEDGHPRFTQDKKDVFQPFMVGPRKCIGELFAWAEMKLILAKVICNFDLELSEKNVGNWADQKVWLMHEKKPLYVKIKRRL